MMRSVSEQSKMALIYCGINVEAWSAERLVNEDVTSAKVALLFSTVANETAGKLLPTNGEQQISSVPWCRYPTPPSDVNA